MKRFKSKKLKKKKKLTKILFLFFFMFSYVYVVIYLNNHQTKKNLLDSNYNYINTNIFKLIEEGVDKTINNPVNLLNSNIKKVSKKISSNNNIKKVEQVSKQEEAYDPIIYIYNTHQTENYNDYSVYELSSYLSEMLTKESVDNYFEMQSVSTVLKENDLKYYKSYTVSRDYLKKALEKYSSLKYFIDIHRDSVSKEKATITYEDKSYAKVLFIVGLDNSNYKENLDNTTILNEMINNKVPGISRGIMKKSGKGVDGVYNQDISSNVFLIEVGTKDSTKQEVINTINVIKDVIISYIGGMV